MSIAWRDRRMLPGTIATFMKSAAALLIVLTSLSCGGSYDETIGGVAVPVPKGMERASEKPTEISLLGFGAGQASFHGTMETNQIVEFYKKELPARGWQANMNLRSGNAVLAYGKEGKTLLIGIAGREGKTTLSLTVSGVGN